MAFKLSMSKSFPVVALRDLLSKSEERITLNPEETYREITIRLWGKGVVLRREVIGAEIGAGNRFIARHQQFILSRIDARSGASGLVPDSLDGAVVTNDFPVFKLNTEKLLPRYLELFSKTADFIDLCKAASEGTTNRIRLKEERFLAMTIPLPTLEEQRRIVAQIEELATKIEEARGLRRETVTEMDSLLSTGSRAIVSSLAGVASRPIRDLVSIQSGGTPSKGNPFFWDGLIPWVSPKDMKSREIHGSADHISEAAFHYSAAKLLNPGCVLVVVRGMILAHTVPAAVLRVEAAINQDIKALLPTDDLLPEYLCSSLWAFNKDLLGLVEKSTHDTRRFETHKLLDFNLPVPPLEEQRRIIAYLDDLQAKVDTLKQLQAETDAELDALLPSVLDRAFQGEL